VRKSGRIRARAGGVSLKQLSGSPRHHEITDPHHRHVLNVIWKNWGRYSLHHNVFPHSSAAHEMESLILVAI